MRSMQFQEIEATEAGVQRSWACRFDVGRHQYVLRIEQRHFVKLEHPGYFEDFGLHNADEKIVHIVKFDNMINEINIGDEFRKLQSEQQLEWQETWVIQKA